MSSLSNTQSPFKSHACGTLDRSHHGQSVRLAGWITHSRKISKNLMFLTLRDETGWVQVVLSAAKTGDQNGRQEVMQSWIKQIIKLDLESVVSIQGLVQQRPEKDISNDDKNGTIEIRLTDFKILNPVNIQLPFLPLPSQQGHPLKELPNEQTRLKYRYLDLRRPELQENLRTRSRVTQLVREYLHGEGFTEIETPCLFKSTPEGAREFLVPTREPGKMYALPQSPQQYKQMLM
jgi:aspartyl-tRNA synthetase